MSGYGRDLSILSDWKVNPRVIKGGLVVAESCIKRLSSNLWYDSDFGYPILRSLNTNVSLENDQTVQSAIEAELLKDDRIDRADVTVTSTGRSIISYIIDIQITLADESGTFNLVVPLNDEGFNIADLKIQEIF